MKSAGETWGATFRWDGQPRTVEVEAAGTELWAGMSLLDRHALHIDVRRGVSVTITERPSLRPFLG